MLFFEAFDQLDVKNDIREVLETVEVKRILMSKSTCSVRIFVESDHILTYQVRRKAEYELRKQILGEAIRCVRIVERYQLSKQYTPEKIMPMYFDSMLAELREESILDYNIVKEAEISFTIENVKLTVDDTFMVKKRVAYIKEKLDEIYHERFSFSVGVTFEYVEPKKKEVEEEEYVMARPVSMKKEQEPVKKEKEAKKKEEPKKQEYNYRAKHPKLPEDPSVIYGRNFDGDVMEISDIQDEIGEVVVRGKVITVEARELRVNRLYGYDYL